MASVDYNARVRKARQNGYSDAEIIAYLAKTDPKVKAAITSGYKPSEIIKFIAPSKAAPRTRGTGISAVDTAIDNAYEVLMGIPEGAYNLAAMVTDPISGMIFGEDAVKQAQAQRRAITDKASRTYVSQPRPLARNLGQSIAPGAAVSRTAALAAPVVSKIPVVGDAAAQILNATARGGIGVKGTSVPKTVGLKVVGGGTSGASTAALMGEDPVEGALYGAGIPVLGTVFKKLVGGGVDLFRLSKVKAGKILRDALGKDVEAAKAAFAQLSPDDQRLAQQVLIDAGVEPSPFFGVGKIVADQIDPDTPARILKQQEAARNARLAGISGGADATAQRAAAEAGRRDVSVATGPAREAALGNIKETNVAVSEAERLANAARQQAAEQSRLARRMTFGAERAETRVGQADDLGDAFDPRAVSRERGIAGAMTQRGEQAAQQAIDLRQQARDMDDIVAELAAQNREPLLAAPLVTTLRQQAGAEGVRTSSARRALLKLASQIEGAADQNGMLNPYDLYTIRKEASDIVEKYVASSAQPSTGSKKRAAGLVIGFKNAVDESLGPEFKDYLVQHQRGMQNVNIQELAARGAQLAEGSPDEFIALMNRKRPEIVEDVYGKGTNQFDIAGMALADPRRYNAMKMSADELQNLNRMTELQSRGETAGGNLLFKEQPSFLSRGIRSVIGAKFPSVAYAGQGLNQTQRALMAPEVQKQLATAYESGPNMAKAMNEFPTATRVSEQVQQISPTARNVMAQQFASPPTIGSEFGFPEIDPDSGEPLVDIDFSEGYPVPIYGRISRNMMRR
jgi:hypothetical protein